MIEAAASLVAELAPPGPVEPAMPPMIAALRSAGLLRACATGEHGGRDLTHPPGAPARLMRALAAIGGADLSAGRLFEGHVNAVKLVILYGGDRRAAEMRHVAAGALYGVWGADGRDPVRMENGMLSGQKHFASGADVVHRAIVSARDPAGAIRLFLLPRARLAGRLHPGEWSATGMRATASGRCDLDGLAVGAGDALGRLGDFLREPWFGGGTWRYAAVQLGAMRAMTRETASALEARGQVAAPLQSARLRGMAMACETARLWIAEAAAEVERAEAPPDNAAVAQLARLATARAARDLMAAMDDALGAASFATAHPVERRRRDLMVYLRQAAPDAAGQAALDTLRADPGRARRWAVG